ncbi:MAG: hypothetical protein WC569_06140, partial [Candidatus Omnitrophota bacterium]
DVNEVKEVLMSFPGAKEARLKTTGDELWGHRIHAEMVFSAGYGAVERDMLSFCRERMANYKIPRTINVIVD